MKVHINESISWCIIPILALLGLASCRNNSNNSAKLEVTKKTVTDKTDLLVATKVVTEDISYGSSDNMTFYLKDETNDDISIWPTSGYFDEYISKERMELNYYPYDGNWCDNLDYPTLNFYITNNSGLTLSINSLNITVEKSEPDEFPYLYLYQDGDFSNSIFIWNESWGDWGNITFDYKILKKGEVFEGKYDKKLTIPYFKDFMIIDFYNDLKDMGYNPAPYGCSTPEESELLSLLQKKYMISGNGCNYSHLFMPSIYLWDDENVIDYNAYFTPFEFSGDGDFIGACGFARFYGKLSFSESDFTKDIKGIIYLSPPHNGGAEMELKEKFDILLKTDGRDYNVRKPYVASIAPGESEMIQLTFRCPRSATHRFYLDIENENGLKIRSKNINLYLLNGRHSTMQPEILEMYAPYED